MEQDGNHSFPNLLSSFYSAPYEFTMEKVLFVGFLLKERLVINLESLLLHGNEDLREQILDREEKGGKSKV